MFYKQLVLRMKHNAIRTPVFCNCWFEFRNLFLKTFSVSPDVWLNTWSFSLIRTWNGRSSTGACPNLSFMSCAFLKGIYFTGTAEILLNMMLGKEKKLPFQSVVW